MVDDYYLVLQHTTHALVLTYLHPSDAADFLRSSIHIIYYS